MKNTGKNIYLILAFIEGAAVMGVELLWAKMASVFYGNSLYVWTSILSIAVAGLAAGYYTGGYISKRFTGKSTLYFIFLISSILV